jgi:hypothetical protein
MPNANVCAKSTFYGASEGSRYGLTPARPLTAEERREDNERQKQDEKR